MICKSKINKGIAILRKRTRLSFFLSGNKDKLILPTSIPTADAVSNKPTVVFPKWNYCLMMNRAPMTREV